MDYSLLMNRVSICFSSSRRRVFIQPAAIRSIRSEWLALAGPDFRPSRARPSASPAGSSKMPRRSTDVTSPVWTPHSTSRSGSGSPPWPPRSPASGRTHPTLPSGGGCVASSSRPHPLPPQPRPPATPSASTTWPRGRPRPSH